MSVSVVILAAGRGDRMQTGINKMFMPIHGQPLIYRTVRAFTQMSDIKELVLVVQPNEMKAVKQLIHPLFEHFQIVEGGTTRRDSALAGVRAASGDIVLIHDGARPFPSTELILRVLAGAEQANASIPVLPITDLLHRVGTTGRIGQVPETSKHSLVRAQTPQGFQRDLILRCLEAAPPEIRDDATAILLTGEPVTIVPGERANIKITRPDDLPLAEAIATSRDV
jgi:2-C-methyl-D-erythritol 4-phosphate cytidylyltransferase